MKILSTVLVTSMMSLSSFTHLPVEVETSLEAEAQKTAQHVVKAFQQQSVTMYAQLFPSVSDFLKVMDNNQHIYGDLLEEAKQDFINQYITELVPAVEESFTQQLEIGKQRGIKWEKITYQKLTLTQASDGSLMVTIKCLSEGYSFSILVKQAMRFDGRVHVSQYVVLV